MQHSYVRFHFSTFAQGCRNLWYPFFPFLIFQTTCEVGCARLRGMRLSDMFSYFRNPIFYESRMIVLDYSAETVRLWSRSGVLFARCQTAYREVSEVAYGKYDRQAHRMYFYSFPLQLLLPIFHKSSIILYMNILEWMLWRYPWRMLRKNREGYPHRAHQFGCICLSHIRVVKSWHVFAQAI